jgi:DNA-binding beta-propeller fold protein YncE
MSNILLDSRENLSNYMGIACDNYGHIFVCDTYNHRIQVFKLEPLVTSKMFSIEFLFSFGKNGKGDGRLNNPTGIACDNYGHIYVCDTYNHRIQVFKFKFLKAEFLFSFGKNGKEDGQFNFPKGITCDHFGNIFVCDTWNDRIQVFNSKGDFLYSFGEQGREEGKFLGPKGITCDQDGNIIVCDSSNHRIQIFRESNFLFSFGKYGVEKGEFKYPVGITTDQDKNIVVCDSGNHRIQIFKFETSSMFPIGLHSKLKLGTSLTTLPKFINSIEPEKGKNNFIGITCDHFGNYIVCDLLNKGIKIFKGPTEVPSLVSLCWKYIIQHFEKINNI